MQFSVQWFPRLLSSLLLTSLLACPHAASDHGDRIETAVAGRAPWNASGEVRVFGGPSSQLLKTVKVDESGRFEATLAVAQGPLTLEAWGGSYVELASGSVAHVDGLRLRAAVPQAKAGERVAVVISPWTEIAVAGSQGDQASYARLLHELSTILSCNNQSLMQLLSVDPATPGPGSSVQSLSAASLAFVWQGAWSRMASELSDEAKVQPGARITSMALAQLVSKDMSDGHLDGAVNGVPVEAANGLLLPSGLLRQRLAQAARHFLDDADVNKSGLQVSALLDVLQCVSKNENATFGTRGEPMDLDPPDLAIHSPAEGAVLAGAAEVSCSATDRSEIVNLGMRTERNGSLLVRLDEALNLDLNGTEASARAKFHSALVEDGSASVVCHARDRWSNQQAKTTRFAVNNTGGRPSVSVANIDAEFRVRGTVRITCSCEDAYLTKCALAEPLLPGLSLLDQTEISRIYAWDTAQLMDGQIEVTCQDWSAGQADPTSVMQLVTVDNVSPGVAEGSVALDSLVRNVKVTAYAYEDGKRGRILGSADAPTGMFRVNLADNYRGPILFEAAASKDLAATSTFDSAVLGEQLGLVDGRVTLLHDHYEPGDSIPSLSMSALSTLAEAYATALHAAKPDWIDDTSIEGASKYAHLVWAQHVRPEQPFDIRTTPVHSFAHPAPEAGKSVHVDTSRGYDSILMGLFTVGVSRLCAESSLDFHGMPHGVTITHALAVLRNDLQDLVLDGVDAKHGNAQLYLTPNRIVGSQFLRYELSTAIRRWLNNDAFDLAEQIPGRNFTTLTARQFSRPGQLLRNLARDEGRMFGTHKGKEFDLDGPELAVRVESGGRKVNLRQPQTGVLSILVKASDDSGVRSITAAVNGKSLPKRVDTLDLAEFILDPARQGLADGKVFVQIDAQDVIGNASPTYLVEIELDNIGPRLEMPQTEIWTGSPQVMLRGVLSKACKEVRVLGASLSQESVVYDVSGDFEIPITVACNASQTLSLLATDYAGNQGHSSVALHCDDTPPVVEVSHQAYTSEEPGFSVVVTDGPFWSSTPTFVKRYEAMDYLPLQGRDKHTGNLPALHFKVRDRVDGREGCSDSEVKVSYRATFANGSQARDWEALDPLESGSDDMTGHHGAVGPADYQVVVSYQTLLPQALLAAGEAAAKAQNYIAHSTAQDVHELQIRVEDKAGNSRVYGFPFRLDLKSAPVTVSECVPTANVRRASLSGGTMGEAFNVGSPISRCILRWPSVPPAASLAPQGRVRVAVGGGSVTSAVRRLGVEYVEKVNYHPSLAECRPFNFDHRIVWEDNHQCQHSGRSDWNRYPREHEEAAAHGTAHPALMRFSSASGVDPRASDTSLFLTPGQDFYVEIINSGALMGPGGVFDWSLVQHHRGAQVYQWTRREGMEAHKSFPWFEIKGFFERKSIVELSLSRHPLNVQVVSLEGVPSPVTVTADSSTAGHTLVWNRGIGQTMEERF